MYRIPFTQFVQCLCDNESARIGRFVKKATGGPYIPTTHFLEEIIEESGTPYFRTVEHRQTNAIRFSGGSWLEFNKSKHVSRRCYAEKWHDKEFIIMVDHQEPYTDDFGTSVREQSVLLIYMLRGKDANG